MLASHPVRLSLQTIRTWKEHAASGLRCGYEYLVFYGTLGALSTISLFWSLLAAVLFLLLPHKLGTVVGQRVIMRGFRFFVGIMKLGGIIKCDFSVLDALKSDASLVIAPNHPSLLDAVLIISRLPRAVCIMKAELCDNLILGGGSRLAGYIRNDSPLNMIKHAAIEVQAGRQLLVFPEGTRTEQELVNPFKGGFALIAKMAGAPVQTVFIECNSPFLGKACSFFKKPRFPVIYKVRLGRRFVVGDDVQRFVRELEGYYRDELGTKR